MQCIVYPSSDPNDPSLSLFLSIALAYSPHRSDSRSPLITFSPLSSLLSSTRSSIQLPPPRSERTESTHAPLRSLARAPFLVHALLLLDSTLGCTLYIVLPSYPYVCMYAWLWLWCCPVVSWLRCLVLVLEGSVCISLSSRIFPSPSFSLSRFWSRCRPSPSLSLICSCLVVVYIACK